ncbi:MBL fold metallo-hydrolase [Vibrio alfacsensis]|uniref:MBL fold metallo-hydrolase n=1 Tax=Vibrio alfacsensis TaxID=1074311 RepID=UPI002ADDF588|nr:MBL fold metallo-hydrolase [Vibrio alfacsensis]WQE78925.1 MBL fold metallo-hydrolase [Vibrio alfacsensis]
MKFTQVRNATAIIEYANSRFLIDPLFAPKEAYPGLLGTYNDHLNWPTVELPMPVDAILEDIDAVIVTHTHPDHWDEYAIEAIPKTLQIFAQNEDEATQIRQAGFNKVEVLGSETLFNGIKLSKTSGQHGSDEAMAMIGKVLGEVSGVVFSHPTEKTAYLAGDTLWNQHVEDAIAEHKPEVMILNTGDAVSPFGSIIMGKQDTLKAHQFRPNSMIIATHMESVNHATLTRTELNDFIDENNISDFVLVPEDGETCQL